MNDMEKNELNQLNLFLLQSTVYVQLSCLSICH